MKAKHCVALLTVTLVIPILAQDIPLRAKPIEPITIAPSSKFSGNWIAAGLRSQAELLRLNAAPMATRWNDLVHIPRIGDGERYTAGKTYKHAAKLARRMEQEGFLPAGQKAAGETGDVYTEELANAVRLFQEDRKLVVDGILGPNTWETLEKDPSHLLATLELNIPRAEKLPANLGDRYLLVNVPSGQLYLFDKGALQSSMKVVYGKFAPGQETPVLSDVMQYVMFNPYWNVPNSIAKNEIVPKAQEDPGYLAAEDYEIVPEFSADAVPVAATAENLAKVAAGSLSLRQVPGPKNPLGEVKFIFPNVHSVYLHDTPQGALFSKTDRGFSHGCIRVENAKALAQFVLGWSPGQVREAMVGNEETKVNLHTALPVYITYFTAMPDPEKPAREVQYFEDVYERDSDT